MNTDIKSALKKSKVKQWQVADELGVSESTFTRWLRYELTADKKESVLAAIKSIAGEKETA